MKKQIAAGVLALGVVGGVGTQTWATVPDEDFDVAVSFKCTPSGADVTFASTDDETLDVRLWFSAYENGAFKDKLRLAPGKTRTVSTDESLVDYTLIENKPEGDSVRRGLDISECFDDDDDDDESDPPSKAPDAGVVG